MHTPEQAKQLQCRQIAGLLQPIETGSIAQPGVAQALAVGVTNCVADKCMGWRWTNNGRAVDGVKWGYCGFAGPPWP